MTNLKELYQELAAQYAVPVGGEVVESFSDKGQPHTYLDFYHQHFALYERPIKLLEIGVKTGGSMLLWKRYFDQAQFVGVDLSPTWSAARPFQAELEKADNIQLIWSQDSTRPIPVDIKFDVIIDDGAHDVETQWATFKNCWPQLVDDGSYFIEDIVDEAAAQELIRRIQTWLKPIGTEYVMYRYVGDVARRADDQILVIHRK